MALLKTKQRAHEQKRRKVTCFPHASSSSWHPRQNRKWAASSAVNAVSAHHKAKKANENAPQLKIAAASAVAVAAAYKSA
jgi:hypothetical protein